MNRSGNKFSFHFVKDKKFKSLSNSDALESLLKWSLHGRLLTLCYVFDQKLESYEFHNFILDFIRHSDFFNRVKFLLNPPYSLADERDLDVQIKEIPTSIKTMGFFDRLVHPDIVRENGRINLCMDEYLDDITIGDQLRKALLIDSSDYYSLFSERERREFIFRLFKHFCIGGEWCQPDENIDPLLKLTRNVYKDLLRVIKDTKNQNIVIVSKVFEVMILQNDKQWFPSVLKNQLDYCYIIIDQAKRQLTVLFHVFGPPFKVSED